LGKEGKIGQGKEEDRRALCSDKVRKFDRLVEQNKNHLFSNAVRLFEMM